MPKAVTAPQAVETGLPSKVCAKCGEAKPLDQYYHGGRDGACKQCYCKQSIRWAKANPDRVKVIDRRCYRKTYVPHGEVIPIQRRLIQSPSLSQKRLDALRVSPKARAWSQGDGVKKNFADARSHHPRLQPDPRHALARLWRLRDPRGRLHVFKNLRHFVRKNPDLFEVEDTIWRRTPRGAADYCRASQGLAALSPRRKHPNCSWKGWVAVATREAFDFDFEDPLHRRILDPMPNGPQNAANPVPLSSPSKTAFVAANPRRGTARD